VRYLKNGFPHFLNGGQLHKMKYLAERRDPSFQITGNFISRSAISYAMKLAKKQIMKL